MVYSPGLEDDHPTLRIYVIDSVIFRNSQNTWVKHGETNNDSLCTLDHTKHANHSTLQPNSIRMSKISSHIQLSTRETTIDTDQTGLQM